MSDAPTLVVGAVLCGGASRRMGRPKAVAELDGRPLAAHAAGALAAAGAARVVLVGGDAAWADALGLALVPDRWPGEGPLGGLATAVLDAATDEDPGTIVVVAACDQPRLDPTDLGRLVAALEARPQAGAAAPRTPDGRVHPLPSAWRVRTGTRLATLMASGSRRADAGFGLVTLAEVLVDPAGLADADTPAELAGLADPSARRARGRATGGAAGPGGSPPADAGPV